MENYKGKTLEEGLSDDLKSKNTRVRSEALKVLLDKEYSEYIGNKLDDSKKMQILYDAKLVKELDLTTKERLWEWKIEKELEKSGFFGIETKEGSYSSNLHRKQWHERRLRYLNKCFAPEILIDEEKRIIGLCNGRIRKARAITLKQRLDRRVQFNFNKIKKGDVTVDYPNDEHLERINRKKTASLQREFEDLALKNVILFKENPESFSQDTERIFSVYKDCKKDKLKLSKKPRFFLAYRYNCGGRYLGNGRIVIGSNTAETIKHEIYHDHLRNSFPELPRFLSEGLASVYGGNHNSPVNPLSIKTIPKNFKQFTESVGKDYYFAKKFIEFCGGREKVEDFLRDYCFESTEHGKELERKGYFQGYLSRKLGYKNIYPLYRDFISTFKQEAQKPESKVLNNILTSLNNQSKA
jgi:hypothetical protein